MKLGLWKDLLLIKALLISKGVAGIVNVSGDINMGKQPMERNGNVLKPNEQG
jgi:hypothetical protein